MQTVRPSHRMMLKFTSYKVTCLVISFTYRLWYSSNILFQHTIIEICCHYDVIFFEKWRHIYIIVHYMSQNTKTSLWEVKMIHCLLKPVIFPVTSNKLRHSETQQGLSLSNKSIVVCWWRHWCVCVFFLLFGKKYILSTY